MLRTANRVLTVAATRIPLIVCVAWSAVHWQAHQRQTGAPAASRLETLLASVDVSLDKLTDMVWAAYSLPAPPSDAGAWRATPAPQDGAVLPALVYNHETSGAAILAFPGLGLQPADEASQIPEFVNGAQACVARVMFQDSAAAAPYHRLCDAGGVPRQPLSTVVAQHPLPTVAAQTDELLDAIDGPVVLLTAHSIGCEVALSVGRVHNIPVVCFGAAGSFGAAWVEGWPGLADAVKRSAPDQLFTLQVETDPYSNCLTPRLAADSSRVKAATTCSYPAPSSAGCVGPVRLDYDPFSECVGNSHVFSDYPPPLMAIRCTDDSEASVAQCPLLP